MITMRRLFFLRLANLIILIKCNCAKQRFSILLSKLYLQSTITGLQPTFEELYIDLKEFDLNEVRMPLKLFM